MSKTPQEKEDEIAEAAIAAAEAEAEKETAEGERAATEAAAAGVAAAQAGAALANAEGAKASQRAAEEIERDREEKAWLRDQVSNLHKNSEAQAAMLAETRRELGNLKPALEAIAERLIPPSSKQVQGETEITPEAAAERKEAENRAGKKARQREEKEKQRSRWI